MSARQSDDPRALVANARRIVVKVGSSTLTRAGELRPKAFSRIAGEVCQLLDAKGRARREVAIVSSGAIAAGSHRLGWKHFGRSIPEKQAAAAVGQIGLMEFYQRRFARRGRNVAQVLLTRSGLDDRERFLNARRTLQELLRRGVVPIVNENDTVATEEIRFGDNDNLSATVVNLIGADLLVILTDVDGLYERAPEAGKPVPPLVELVEKVTPSLVERAGGAGTEFGRGGMATKLQAAKSAASSGAATVICNGSAPRILERVARGDAVGTLVLPGSRLHGQKHWLAFTSRTRGKLELDAGACTALVSQGKSLLPAGITRVEGRFGPGEVVSCVDARGRELARGLAAYAAADIDRIKGRTTREIERTLGFSNGDAVVHRDDLVVLEGDA